MDGILVHGVVFRYASGYLLDDDAVVPVSTLAGRASLRDADSKTNHRCHRRSIPSRPCCSTSLESATQISSWNGLCRDF